MCWEKVVHGTVPGPCHDNSYIISWLPRALKISAQYLSWGPSNSFSVDPPGGSTLGEAVFIRTYVRTFVRPSPLTLFVYNSGSE